MQARGKDLMSRSNADIERARALHHLRDEGAALPAGVFCFVAALAIVWWLFADRTAPEPFMGWFTYMAVLLAAMVVAYAVSLIWKPNDDNYLDWFGPIGRWLNFGLTLAVVASVWVLMLNADPERDRQRRRCRLARPVCNWHRWVSAENSSQRSYSGSGWNRVRGRALCSAAAS